MGITKDMQMEYDEHFGKAQDTLHLVGLDFLEPYDFDLDYEDVEDDAGEDEEGAPCPGVVQRREDNSHLYTRLRELLVRYEDEDDINGDIQKFSNEDVEFLRDMYSEVEQAHHQWEIMNKDD